MSTINSQCYNCVRYRKDTTCEAYPKGIPDEIFLNEWNHKKNYPGDQGKKFKKIKKEGEK